MSLTVYGIKNCNTVKSAIEWLTKNKISFTFHDYKTRGVTEAKLTDWAAQLGWESLVNKRGTTWRLLNTTTQEKIRNESAAIALMKEKTSVIKRPLIEADNKIIALGFDENDYKRIFKV